MNGARCCYELEFDLTGGFLADAKIVGRKLSNNAAAMRVKKSTQAKGVSSNVADACL